MNETYLRIFLSLLIPTLFGFNLLSLFFRGQKLDRWLKLSLSYGLGTGVIALWMFCVDLLNIPFNLTSTTISLIFINMFLVIFNIHLNNTWILKSSTSLDKNLINQPHNQLEIYKLIISGVLISFIMINVLYVFWRALNIPINSYDAFATIAFKAKIFFFEENVPPLNKLPHPTYPLLVPLTLTWTTINLGEWSDQLIHITFPCLFLSFLIIFYNFLKYSTDNVWALFGVAVLISSNFLIFHATIAYRDLTLMYFNCSTIMLLLLWQKSDKIGFLITASLFSGIATFVKLEGTAFLFIHCFIAILIIKNLNNSSIRQKIKYFLTFVIPNTFICFSFIIYKLLIGVTKDGEGIGDKTGFEFSIEKIQFIPKIFESFILNLLTTGNWNIIWLALFLSLIFLYKENKNSEIKILLISLTLYFVLYFFIALFTTNYIWIAGDYNATTLSRLILHFFPLSVLLIIFLNFSKKHNEKKLIQENSKKENTTA